MGGGRLLVEDFVLHVEEVFVGFEIGGEIYIVHGVGAFLFDEVEAVFDHGEVVLREVFGVVEAGFVEVFDEFAAGVGVDGGVVDGVEPGGVGVGIGADEGEGDAAEVLGDGWDRAGGLGFGGPAGFFWLFWWWRRLGGGEGARDWRPGEGQHWGGRSGGATATVCGAGVESAGRGGRISTPTGIGWGAGW